MKNKEATISKKIKSNINNWKQYRIFESKQFIGLILLVVFSFLFVVSIVQVRGFSTINSYTVGMLFGYYSYFIYVGFIALGSCLLFQIDVLIERFIAKKFNRKIYFTWLPYLFFALGVALVVESIVKSSKTNSLFPGAGAFNDFFEDWWRNFTNNYGKDKGSTPLLPNVSNNSGIVVSLFMSLIVSWSGYIISIVIGIVFIAYFVYYTFYGSIIKRVRMKIFKNSNRLDSVNKKEFEEYKTKIMDLSFEDSHGIVQKPNHEIAKDIEIKTTTIAIDNSDNMFPIDNPIEEENGEININFVEEKTSQINLEKNLTKEFKIDSSIDKNPKSTPDIETFDFELDIFNTGTNAVSIDDEILLEKRENSLEFSFDNESDNKNKNK